MTLRPMQTPPLPNQLIPQVYLVLWRMLRKSNWQLCPWRHGASAIQIFTNVWKIITQCGGPLLWKFLWQFRTVLSSSESENIATNECAKDTISLRNQAADIDMIGIASPTVVYNDNRACCDWDKTKWHKASSIPISENFFSWMTTRGLHSPDKTYFPQNQLYWHFHQGTPQQCPLSEPQKLVHVLTQILLSVKNRIITVDTFTANCQWNRIATIYSQSSKTVGAKNIFLNFPPIATFPVPDFIYTRISPWYISSGSARLSGGYWLQDRVTKLGTESGSVYVAS